jgi:hypothetical protein
LYAAAVMFVACRREAAPPPAQQTQTVTTTVAAPPEDFSGEQLKVKVVPEEKMAWDCKPGSTLDAMGAVSEVKSEFARKDPVYVTMFLRDAPPELAVRAVALDEKGKEVAAEQKPAEGAKSVTLNLGSLKPGKYTIKGFWGGNDACEKKIAVN